MIWSHGRAIKRSKDLWAYVCPEPSNPQEIVCSTAIWMKMLLAKSVKRWHCSHQAITLQPLHIYELQEFRLEPGYLPSSHQLSVSLQRSTLKRPRMRKVQDTVPESWGVAISESPDFAPFIYRKFLNSLTWVSVSSNCFLMLQLSGLCFINSYISWLLLGLFRAYSLVIWEAVSWA